MPEDRPSIPRGEIGHVGARSLMWGQVGGETYDPTNISLSTYDEMRRVDETIKAALQFVRLAVCSHLGQYQHPDAQIKDFVGTALRQMTGTIEGACSDFLSALWAGFAIAELVYDIIPSGPWAGKAYYRKIKILHPLTISPKGIKSDDKGNVERIIQSEGSRSEAVLEKGKFAHFVYDGGAGSFGSPWGYSSLRAVHQWWFTKQMVVKLWSIFLEKFAIPLEVGYFPPGPTKCPIDGNAEDNLTAGMHMLAARHGRSEMVFPAQQNRDGTWSSEVPRLETHAVQGDAAAQFTTFLDAADTRIMRGLLVPSLVIAEAQFGTRAQSQTHLDAFYAMLGDILRSLADFLIEQLIRPLLDINFSNLDDYGQWVPQPLTEDDKDVLSNVLFRMLQAGVMDAGDPNLRKWVLQKFAPELAEETVDDEMGGEPPAQNEELEVE